MTRRERVAQLVEMLPGVYPGAHCELNFSNPLELLVATILSAQCTDKRVNEVTKTLFKKYKTPQDYAQAPLAELEEDIRSTGFFHNKAKNIQGCCWGLVKRHHSKVPQTIEELVALPGIGRKTANVVLGNAFGIPGIVVDTHVGRIAQRLGLTEEKDPVKIEFALMPLIPEKHWTIFSHQMIEHGRSLCTARAPQCLSCFLRPFCNFGNLLRGSK